MRASADTQTHGERLRERERERERAVYGPTTSLIMNIRFPVRAPGCKNRPAPFTGQTS